MKTYTCSMHPEVKSDKPGKCPKCGMALVEINRLYSKVVSGFSGLKMAAILFLSFATLVLLTQCNNSTPEKLANGADTRGKVISVLVNNETYMKEVMDSMSTKHPKDIMSMLFVFAKDNRQMQENMMDKMIGMGNNDSAMCKMMMGKTMAMADADPSKCNMMMDSAKSHLNVIKAMLGMCDMNAMKMEQKK